MRRAAAEIELTARGMKIADSPLFLDSSYAQELSFVSHAHSDHLAKHTCVISTATTAAALTRRLGKRPAMVTAPYGQGFDLGQLRLSLHPAGHVRGSAQLLVQREGRRLLYTGDLGLSPSLTAEAAEVVTCDVLILEATFGHPRFRLPTRQAALEMVDAFLCRARKNGETPVLFAYALGKAQEVIAYLERQGCALRVDARIREMTAVYQDAGFGITVPALFEGKVLEGEVLVLSPFSHKRVQLRSIGRRRTAMLTGWAVEAGAARRYCTDEAIPLSDHADFEGLVDYAVRTGARQVFTVHGFCEPLAHALSHRGIKARPLSRRPQLELFE